MGGKVSPPPRDPAEIQALKQRTKLERQQELAQAELNRQLGIEQAIGNQADASMRSVMNNNVQGKVKDIETLSALRQLHRNAGHRGNRQTESRLKKRIEKHDKEQLTNNGVTESRLDNLERWGANREQLIELGKRDKGLFNKLVALEQNGKLANFYDPRVTKLYENPNKSDKTINDLYKERGNPNVNTPPSSPPPIKKKKETYNKFRQSVKDVHAIRDAELEEEGFDPDVIKKVKANDYGLYEKLVGLAQEGFPYSNMPAMRALKNDPIRYRDMVNDLFERGGRPPMHEFEPPVSLPDTPESTPPTSRLASPNSSRSVSPQSIKNYKSMQDFDITAGFGKKTPKTKLLSSISALQNNLPEIQSKQREAIKNPIAYNSNINDQYEPTFNPNFFKYAAIEEPTPKGTAPQASIAPLVQNMAQQEVPPPGAGEVSVGEAHVRAINRKMAQLGLHLGSQPDIINPNQQVANTAADTQEAYARTKEHSPYTHEPTIAENAKTKKEIEDLKGQPFSYERAQPYLDRMTQNPAAYHKELMGPEEDAYLKSFEEQMDKDFYDKVLPNAINKYRVPGMKGRGHDSHVVNEVTQEYLKNKAHKLNEIRFGNKMKGYDISQKHAGQLGQAATTTGALTQADIAQKQLLTDMTQKAHEKERNQRIAFDAAQEAIGHNVEKKNQQRLDATNNAFREAQNAPWAKAERLSNLINRHIQPTGTQTHYPFMSKNPTLENANQYQRTGAGLATMSAQFMPQRPYEEPVQKAKKGGLIKLLKKYADGGSVMGQAVQDAVIDKESPLHELRRLMNRQRLEQYQKKSVQRRFRQGGAVGPIQKGAQEAQEFMADKELRGRYQSLKQQPEGFSGSGAIKAFMKGYGSLDDTASSKAARGFVSQMDEIDLERKNNETQKTSAFEKLYNLDKEKKKELSDLRKEERDLKKLGIDERVANAKLAKYAAESNVSSNAIIDPPVRKQTKEDKKAVQKANDIMAMAFRHKESLGKLKEVVDVPTSPQNANIIKTMPLGLGYPLVSLKESIFGEKGSKTPSSEDLKTFEDRAQEAFQSGIDLNKTTQSAGGRFTNMSHQALESSKVGLASHPKSNKEKIGTGEYTADEIILEGAKMKLNAGVDPDYVNEELKKHGLDLSHIKTGIPRKNKTKEPESLLPTPSETPPPQNPPMINLSKEDIAEELRKRGRIQ